MADAVQADRLARLGWDDRWAALYAAVGRDGDRPGRVSRVEAASCTVMCAGGDVDVPVAGRLFHRAASAADAQPAVGDWVVLEGGERISAILPRRSAFSRKVAGLTTAEQVVAANVDMAFLVEPLDGDVRLRRLERYLAVAWESGAVPVLVLSKADLCVDVDAALAEAERAAVGTRVLVVSTRSGLGMDELAAAVAPGRTVALVGPSGVGKSTIANWLLGEDVLATGSVRADGRGRHTTSFRQLFELPGGGLLVDTPGMRELALWGTGDGVDRAFADIEELVSSCRFADCGHEREPGCAVQGALASGHLAVERYESWRKLQREQHRLELQQDARAAAAERAALRTRARAFRSRPHR
jgi:ribosome biogenesis GTPase / thiamine phosphate phosphatase